MIIDADYLISKNLVNEILNFDIKNKYIGANADIYHFLYNSVIKENLYPSKIILFKKSKAKYLKVGHKEVLKIKGEIKKFKNFILHEDKKSSQRWIAGQIKIAASELNYILKNRNKIQIKDKIRLIPILPVLLLIIFYLFKINILKYGFGGIVFFYQRIIFESILNFKLIKHYLNF
jgi:hypothetical protein